jgi:hypothetical protein
MRTESNRKACSCFLTDKYLELFNYKGAQKCAKSDLQPTQCGSRRHHERQLRRPWQIHFNEATQTQRPDGRLVARPRASPPPPKQGNLTPYPLLPQDELGPTAAEAQAQLWAGEKMARAAKRGSGVGAAAHGPSAGERLGAAAAVGPRRFVWRISHRSLSLWTPHPDGGSHRRTPSEGGGGG